MNNTFPTVEYLSRAELITLSGWLIVAIELIAGAVPFIYAKNGDKDTARELLAAFGPLSRTERKERQRHELAIFKELLQLSAEALPAITASKRALKAELGAVGPRCNLTQRVLIEYQTERAAEGFCLLEDGPRSWRTG